MHACDHPTPEALYPFDARGIAKRFRHAAIFGAFDALMPGETMRFCNDHDPLPLLGQLQARYGQAIAIRYVQREQGRSSSISPNRPFRRRTPEGGAC